MTTLLEMVQNTNKEEIRRNFIDEIKKDENLQRNERSMHVNTFSQMFDEALRKCGCDPNISVYGYVLCQSLQEKSNTLLDYCVYNGIHEKHHVRFMRFFEFVMSVDREAAQNILAMYSQEVQWRIMGNICSPEDFHTVIKWDRQLTSCIMFNEYESHMHYMMSNGTNAQNIDMIFEKLQFAVFVYGNGYLRWIPSRDGYGKNTLVNQMLSLGNIFYTPYIWQELLSYLIHTCPDALRITSGHPLQKYNTGFTAVVRRCVHPEQKRDQWIVENVMQYADLHRDVYGVVTDTNMTLLDLAKSCNNVLVLQFFARKFNI